MSTGYWTWEKEEAPAKAAFEESYEKIMRRAEKGEVCIREAFWFHETERRFSCKHRSVLKTAVEARPLWKRELTELVALKIYSTKEISHISLLCGGMKHYEFFKELHHRAMMVKYPETWEAEETAEKARVKKAVEIGKRRLAL